MLAIAIKTKEFEIGVEEGVDLGDLESKIFHFPMWCHREELFYSSMLCKWTTSLAHSTWFVCE